MINGFKCSTNPPPIGYSGKLTIIPITDGDVPEPDPLPVESSEKPIVQPNKKEFPEPMIFTNLPKTASQPVQIINSQSLKSMTEKQTASLDKTIKSLKTNSEPTVVEKEEEVSTDFNVIKRRSGDCAESDGVYRTPDKGWAQEEGLRSLNASNFCIYENKCYFDVTIGEKTSITKHDNVYKNRTHPPTKCSTAKECDSSRIKDIKKVNSAYSHAVLPACYVTEANTTKEVYFDQVNPAELINNSAVRCDTEQAMPWSGSSSRNFGGGPLELCSLQNLLLRGACEDRTCSKFDHGS